MDIKGFGPAYVEELIKQGYIKNIADIYTLKNHRDELVEKGIIGKEKNTDKLLMVIEKSKNNEPQRLLTGLGIPNVGKSTAREIIQYFKNIDSLMNATMDELKEVADIGETSAVAIIKYFKNQDNKDIINSLKQSGIHMELESNDAPDDKLVGETFVITGTLPTMSREEATELIQSHGGKVSESVSKKTNYLLAGENAGSKLAKAQELGIAILTEEELIKMTE